MSLLLAPAVAAREMLELAPLRRRRDSGARLEDVDDASRVRSDSAPAETQDVEPEGKRLQDKTDLGTAGAPGLRRRG